MFNNLLNNNVPLSDAVLSLVSSLADTLGGAATTVETEGAEAAAYAMKSLLASMANAIAANSVPGEPPRQIKGRTFAMSVQNVIMPDLSACEADDSCPKLELDESFPGAVLGSGKVNMSQIMSRNASAAPALIVSTKMEGIAGAASVVLQVINVPGNPGKGAVRVVPEVAQTPPQTMLQASLQTSQDVLLWRYFEEVVLQSLQQPPPPPAFASGSAATKLGVSVKDERRCKLREILPRELGTTAVFKHCPKCATTYVSSSNAKTDASCLPAYRESMACEVRVNESYANVTKQEVQQMETCTNSHNVQACEADIALLRAMFEIYTNQWKLCANISAPCGGPDHGMCDTTADVCMCTPEWVGLQCENQPQAVIHGPYGLSRDGAGLQSWNPKTGAALIQGDGPADFSIITETVEPPLMKQPLDVKFGVLVSQRLQDFSRRQVKTTVKGLGDGIVGCGAALLVVVVIGFTVYFINLKRLSTARSRSSETFDELPAPVVVEPALDTLVERLPPQVLPLHSTLATKRCSSKSTQIQAIVITLVVCGLMALLAWNAFALHSYASSNGPMWVGLAIESWTEAGYNVEVKDHAAADLGQDRPLSTYDWLRSDNYKYAELLRIYGDHGGGQTIASGALLVVLALSLAHLVYLLAWRWSTFASSDGDNGAGKVGAGRASQLRAAAAALSLCAATALGEDAWDIVLLVCALLLSTAIAAIAGSALGPSAFVAFFASAAVLLLHMSSIWSPVGRLAAMEALEVLVQLDQLLRWTGTDALALLAHGDGTAAYRKAQAAGAFPAGEAWVLMLTWALTANCVITPCLVVCSGGVFSPLLATFDLLWDLTYGFVGLGAAISASQFNTGRLDAGAPPVLVASNLTGVLLANFPFLLLRLHLPVNVRAVLTAQANGGAAEQAERVAKKSLVARWAAHCAAAIFAIGSLAAAAFFSANVARPTDIECAAVHELCQRPAFNWAFEGHNATVPTDYGRNSTDSQLWQRLMAEQWKQLSEDGSGLPALEYQYTRRSELEGVDLIDATVTSLSGECLCFEPMMVSPSIMNWTVVPSVVTQRFLGLRGMNLEKRRKFDRRLTLLPNHIRRLKLLTFLDVQGNDLPSLPTQIGQLGALTLLGVGSSTLTSLALPTQIGKLSALTTLFADSNAISSLPTQIGQVGALELLRVNQNKITTLPTEIGQLGRLTDVWAAGNNLTSLPTQIGQLGTLEFVKAQNNALTLLPTQIGQLGALTDMWAHINALTALPTQIGQLGALEILTAQQNALTSLPTQIGQLGALELLRAQKNALTSLPTQIGQLGALMDAFISKNDLTSLPTQIGQLGALETLSAGYNELTALPTQLGNLEALSWLVAGSFTGQQAVEQCVYSNVDCSGQHSKCDTLSDDVRKCASGHNYSWCEGASLNIEYFGEPLWLLDNQLPDDRSDHGEPMWLPNNCSGNVSVACDLSTYDDLPQAQAAKGSFFPSNCRLSYELEHCMTVLNYTMSGVPFGLAGPFSCPWQTFEDSYDKWENISL